MVAGREPTSRLAARLWVLSKQWAQDTHDLQMAMCVHGALACAGIYVRP